MAVNSNLSCPMYVSFYLVLFREQKACYNICGNIGFLQADVHTQGEEYYEKTNAESGSSGYGFLPVDYGKQSGSGCQGHSCESIR